MPKSKTPSKEALERALETTWAEVRKGEAEVKRRQAEVRERVEETRKELRRGVRPAGPKFRI